MSEADFSDMAPMTDDDYYSYLGLNAKLKAMAEDLTMNSVNWITSLDDLPETVGSPTDKASDIMEKFPGAWLYWLIAAIIILIFIIINALLQWLLSARIRKLKKCIKELRATKSTEAK